MSLIEGIGDDLLYAFGFLVFIGIVSLAWLSTHVNHFHFPTTLFIIERRTRRRQEEGSDRSSLSPEPSPTSGTASEQVASPTTSQDAPTEHETDLESSEIDETNSEQRSTMANRGEAESVRRETPQISPTVDEETEETMRVVIKFLNDTQKSISAHPNDTISKIKQLYFSNELSNNQMVRFIYQGRELQDQETLRTCNIRDQTIIHCQISTRRNETNSHVRSDGPGSGIHLNNNAFDAASLIDASPVNISSSFVLLAGGILAVCWYLRLKFRPLFTPLTTIILIVITVMFLIFTCGSRFSSSRSVTTTGPTRTIAITPIQHMHAD